jgi:hypothetical protein
MKITGRFPDEIGHDIPSQNWGAKEWDRDMPIRFLPIKWEKLRLKLQSRAGEGDHF